MDISDIELVVQWRATCTLPSLWQRFGCGVRDKKLCGTALLLAEKEHFDDERVAKAARKARREATRKRTAKEADLPRSSRPQKRVALSPANQAIQGTAVPITGRSTQPDPDGDLSDEDDGDDNCDELPIGASGENQTVAGCMQSGTGVDTLVEVMSQTNRRSNEGGCGSKRKRRALDPGVEFLINAESRGLGCRRKVFYIYFDNSSAGGKIPYYPHSSLTSNSILFSQSRITLSVSRTIAKVAATATSQNQLSAVTSTIPQHSPCTTQTSALPSAIHDAAAYRR